MIGIMPPQGEFPQYDYGEYETDPPPRSRGSERVVTISRQSPEEVINQARLRGVLDGKRIYEVTGNEYNWNGENQGRKMGKIYYNY